MRIVADENMPGLEPFQNLGELLRVDGRTLRRAQLEGADVLLVRSVTPVSRALLEGTPVRFVGSATIGTDHVDLPALAELGIAFAHAPGCNARAVVEYVLQALLLACQARGRALRDSQVGLVGLGNVGGRLALWLRALGVEVLACDPPLARAGVATPVPLVPLERVLEAELISLHVPLIRQGEDATWHLLDARRLARLGATQTLISTCRGAVIDNAALTRCLAGGQGPFTVLDVWEGEPRIDATLLGQVRFGSPHVAGYSVEGKTLGTAMLYQAYCDWRACEPVAAVPTRGAGILARPVGNEEELLALLNQAYRLRDDDRRLRASVHEARPGAAFDALRKRYPPRHELHHWRHDGSVAAPFRELVSLLFEPAGVTGSGNATPAPALYRPGESSPR